MFIIELLPGNIDKIILRKIICKIIIKKKLSPGNIDKTVKRKIIWEIIIKKK